MKMFVILAVTLFAFAACDDAAEKSIGVSNSNFKVERLFTDDNGYSVMRFEDGGSKHYYVIGPNHLETRKNNGESVYESIPTEKQ